MTSSLNRRRGSIIVAIAALSLASAGAAVATTEPAEPTGTEPMATEPMGTEPMGSEPMGSMPMGSEPMGSMPMGSEPAGTTAPGGEAPAGSEPTAGGPTGPLCAAVPTDGEGSAAGMADDPVATAASNNPLLSTLVAAVDAAGLVDTLNGGEFTVFAPINSAFDKVDQATLEGLLADPTALGGILTFHVLEGRVSGADLAAGGSFPTVNGAELTFAQVNETLVINGGAAAVQCADVQTANATVHLIDSVLLPPA